MNNWYAQKLLADDYAAERRHEANRHRRVRADARRAARSARRSSAASLAAASPSRWRAALSGLARRRAASARTPASAPSPASAPVRSGHATAAS